MYDRARTRKKHLAGTDSLSSNRRETRQLDLIYEHLARDKSLGLDRKSRELAGLVVLVGTRSSTASNVSS